MEGQADFLQAGGGEYHYIPALNERDDWIAALTGLIESHLGGWPTREVQDASSLALSATRAKALGQQADRAVTGQSPAALSWGCRVTTVVARLEADMRSKSQQ